MQWYNDNSSTKEMVKYAMNKQSYVSQTGMYRRKREKGIVKKEECGILRATGSPNHM